MYLINICPNDMYPINICPNDMYPINICPNVKAAIENVSSPRRPHVFLGQLLHRQPGLNVTNFLNFVTDREVKLARVGSAKANGSYH